MSDSEKANHFTKEIIDVEGHQMGMFIESTDCSNPVLLFLHGGPGFPQFPIIKQSGLNWANDFTVCYWEQRGTGMSYNASTQGVISLEKAIEDTVYIAAYLKKKFNKKKIYLCGHSWGTLVSSAVVHRFPAIFHAYIGMGQMGRHYESNRDTYQFLLETAVIKEDKKAEKDIKSISFDRNFYKNKEYRRILSKYLGRYGGGTTRTGYSNWQGMKDMFIKSPYTWKEKWNIPKGIFSSYDALSKTMASSDTVKLAPRIDVPVFIIHGAFDYQTSLKEAERFFHYLEAPVKKFFKFDDCAHSPFLEDQERFMSILRTEVLQQREN